MKRKWWIIPLAIVCIAAILIGVFWEEVAVHAAPKAVLTTAISNTIDELKTRMEGSPLPMLAGTIDQNGQNTIVMDLQTSDELLGDVSYDMTLRTDASNQKISADGTVTAKGTTLDLSVYLDTDFAALTSQSLLKGSFYGITYDSFSEDIRGNKILPFLIGEQRISEWEASVSGLQDDMEQMQVIKIPQISEKDLQTLALGIIALKADVSCEDQVLNGERVRVHKISFSADGSDLTAAMDYLLQEGILKDNTMIAGFADRLKADPDTQLFASFWVYEGSVLKAVCEIGAGEKDRDLLELAMGADAAVDPLTFRIISNSGETLSVSSHAAYDTDRYSEHLEIEKTSGAEQKQWVVDYDWNRSSGDALLVLKNAAAESRIDVNFVSTDTGFRLQTDKFEAIMDFLDPKEGEPRTQSRCTMSVSKGTDVETPEYKNLNRWSMEDLLILLGGIGSLFGLNLES